ncbi:MAG: DUF4384 domain-containing protein [Bacteroidota bacterium]
MMKRLLVVMVAGIFVMIHPISTGGSDPGVLIAQDEQTDVSFKWAFVGVLDPSGRKKVVPIQRDTVLASGDQFKLYVQPVITNCYVYMIWYDSKKDLHMMFPYDFEQFSTDWVEGKNYYIPKGREWYELDENKGREVLYLLAAKDRLKELEELLKQYASASGDEKEVAKARVLNELRDVRKRFRKHTTLTEKPAIIAGNVRGSGGVGVSAPTMVRVTQFAIQVDANTFFSKTIIIQHK